MEAVIAIVKNLLRNPRVALILGAILGLILGLLIGYKIWPVQWTGGTPEVMRADLQEDYLRMAVESYAKTNDPNEAMRRWDDLAGGANDTYIRLQANPGSLDPSALQNYGTLVQTLRGPIVPSAQPEGGSGLSGIVLYASILVVVILLGAGGLYLYRLLRKGPGATTAHSIEQSYSRQVQRTDFSSLGVETPITHVVIPYVYGDDYFDESNSIDSPGGEMLGEYGVGITDYFKPSEPKKVTALDVWLFDTKGIATDTKVILSKYAFENRQVVERLSAKGELILAENNKEFTLETKTLILLVKISEVAYGQGPQPDQSYFDRLILEMAVWSKPNSEVAQDSQETPMA